MDREENEGGRNSKLYLKKQSYLIIKPYLPAEQAGENAGTDALRTQKQK